MPAATSPLSETEIRYIVREAQIAASDGADPKLALVNATQAHLIATAVRGLTEHVANVIEGHELIAGDYDGTNEWVIGLQEATKPLFEEMKIPALTLTEVASIMADPTGGMLDPDERRKALGVLLYARVKAQRVDPLPPNRGKWLAKHGIVAAHIAAIGSAPAPAEDSAEISDAELAEMMGGEAPAAVAPPLPLDAQAYAAGAAVASAAPSPAAAAAPGGSPPPPPPSSVREAFLLFHTATEVDTTELAQALGVARASLHNYLTGKTQRVRIGLAEARRMAAECDKRMAALRAAATIFAEVRP